MVTRSPPSESVPDFTPVPRKCERHDGWTAERQRGFIAALAELGSVSGACRRVAMASYGAYALRRAEGAESFRRAWKQALDMGAQRLADIAMERAIEGVSVPIMYHGEQVAERRHYNDRLLTFMLRHHQPETYGDNGALRPGRRSARLDEVEAEDDHAGYVEAIGGIARKMIMCRRLLLAALCDHPDKRAAWEVLVGPADWDKARRLERQDDEPFAADPARPEDGLPNLRGADMVLTAEAGLLGEYCGGPDKLAEIRDTLDRLRAQGATGVEAEPEPDAAAPAQAELPPEERAAIDARRARLIAEGWTEDAHGNLWSPDPSA